MSVYIREMADGYMEKYPIDRIIFDFSGVEFMDSSGIALVIGAYKRATSVGSSFYVINVSKQAYKVFSAPGICKLLNISARENEKLNV